MNVENEAEEEARGNSSMLPGMADPVFSTHCPSLATLLRPCSDQSIPQLSDYYFPENYTAVRNSGGSARRDPLPCHKARDRMFQCKGDFTECIPLDQKCNGVSECSTGRDESVPVCGCLANEFQCSNTTCIDAFKRCDTHQDCENGSDEQGCETFICPITHVKCNNHFCVPRDARCNFVNECGDNSDEENCKYRDCYSTEFKCNNSECIGNVYLCDEEPQCKDGSDEIDCDQHVICENGLYVRRELVCDGWVDCEDDHADELNCGPCAPRQYQCLNSRCISMANVCDGHCDCLNTCEDEQFCKSLECPINQKYLCPKTGLETRRCIPEEFVCDGYNDCRNTVVGGDEYFCWNTSKECRDFPDSEIRNNPFVCPEGRCIRHSSRCNYIADCINGEDEVGCVFPDCSADSYRCKNNQCIPMMKYCNGDLDCYDGSDEVDCELFACLTGHKKCQGGQCVAEDKWCDFVRDCPDNSDEASCVRRQCSSYEFECRNGQCINHTARCYKGRDPYRQGCIDGSHLKNCRERACDQGEFKCRNSYCIDASQECDTHVDCFMSYWDELHCPFQCPHPTNECICKDIEMDCTNRGLRVLPKSIENSLSKFQLSGNYLNWSLNSFVFDQYDRLTFLELSNNSIQEIPHGTFATLWRLDTLSLEMNDIAELKSHTFEGMTNLKMLYLRQNKLRRIEPYAFVGLSSLRALDLSGQKLTILGKNVFSGLRGVMNLNLSNNRIEYIEDGAFNGLDSLLVLDISGNQIETIQDNVFNGLGSLKTLYTDEYRFCCLATNTSTCTPEPDEFSSCQDLMSNTVLRISVWVLGMVATFGNMLVAGWRVREIRTGKVGKVHSFLITNLAFGDYFMGVYLLIIAGVDSYYRGNYIIYDKFWRQSALCEFAGFLSTVSSESSVFTLTIITLDRLVCIIFPFKIPRLGLKQARIAMAVMWLFALLLSIVPLCGLEYFDNFYGRSGVCLPLHITNSRPKGWEYSVFVFIAVNFASFLIIFLSYFWMFIVAKRTQSAVRMPQNKSDAAMARRMTMIVLTDFFCWVPIILLGIASLSGANIPTQVYAWIAVFVLPLNAAINPVLYTISTAPFMGNVQRRASYFRKSFVGSTNGDTRHSYIDDRSSNWDRERSRAQYTQLELMRMRSVARAPAESSGVQTRSFTPVQIPIEIVAHQSKLTDTDSEC